MPVENSCGWYGDVLLLRATEAAGHVPVESSGTVAQSVMFIACMSSVLQVPQPLLLFSSRFVRLCAVASASLRCDEEVISAHKTDARAVLMGTPFAACSGRSACRSKRWNRRFMNLSGAS
jgi:hypothetical protein